MRGKLGWIAWRAVILKVIPSADRRLRVIADWMIWPLVGRDVVQMGPSQTAAYDVRHHVYQAGETISDLGRPVRLVHVIVEGEVDLVRGAEGEDSVDTIGPGDHFGRKLLQHRGAQSARARSLVRTLTLREDQANKLQDVLLSTSRIVARTGMTRTIDVEELRRAREH